jgi:hypothetical protein
MPFLSQAYIASLDNEAYGKLLATTRQIGLHPQTHDPFLVSLQDLRAGTTILGSQGGGKTRLILSLIMQEILSNQPVIVIDPHGDLTQDCIAMLPDELPREWRDKIYLLDMEDEQYPFGVNVFSGHSFTSSLALGQAINQVRHIFEVQWPEITRQQHLPKYLLACTIVLFKVTWNMEYSIRNINYVDFVLIHWRSYEEESAYST